MPQHLTALAAQQDDYGVTHVTHVHICKSCDSQNIENEYHFILDCARHKDLRDHLLYYDNNQSNESNVSDIFGDILRTKTLAEYIIRALKERTK